MEVAFFSDKREWKNDKHEENPADPDRKCIGDGQKRVSGAKFFIMRKGRPTALVLPLFLLGVRKMDRSLLPLFAFLYARFLNIHVV